MFALSPVVQARIEKEAKYSDFKDLKFIGEGGFATVW